MIQNTCQQRQKILLPPVCSSSPAYLAGCDVHLSCKFIRCSQRAFPWSCSTPWATGTKRITVLKLNSSTSLEFHPLKASMGVRQLQNHAHHQLLKKLLQPWKGEFKSDHSRTSEEANIYCLSGGQGALLGLHVHRHEEFAVGDLAT